MSRREDEVQRVFEKRGDERNEEDVDALVESFKHMTVSLVTSKIKLYNCWRT